MRAIPLYPECKNGVNLRNALMNGVVHTKAAWRKLAYQKDMLRITCAEQKGREIKILYRAICRI
jgi:hypothetical protein